MVASWMTICSDKSWCFMEKKERKKEEEKKKKKGEGKERGTGEKGNINMGGL